MNRSLTIVVVLLALILGVGPMALGRVGQNQIERQLTYATDAYPGIQIIEESNEAGWFSGFVKHRIVFTDAVMASAIQDALGQDQAGGPPALVISTRLDYGPIAFSSLGRKGGSLVPAMNRSITTFEVDLGNGEPISVPGRMLWSVSFDGTNRAQFVVDPGSYSFPDEDAEFNWEGVDISIEMGRDADVFAAEGVIKPFGLVSPEGGVSVSAIEFETEQNKTAYEGLWVGHTAYSMDLMQIADPPSNNVSIQGLTAGGRSDLEGGFINGSGNFNVADIDGLGFYDVAVDVSFLIESWDAEVLQAITRIVKEIQSSADPVAAQEQYVPEILNRGQQLANGGARLAFDKIRVELPQGDVNATIDLRFDKNGSGQTFSPEALLMALHADVTLEVPEALVGPMISGQGGNPLFGMALAYFERDGTHYRLAAQFENGILTVNGTPIPLPIP